MTQIHLELELLSSCPYAKESNVSEGERRGRGSYRSEDGLGGTLDLRCALDAADYKEEEDNEVIFTMEEEDEEGTSACATWF